MDGKSIWMDYNEIKNQVVQQNKDDVSASEIYENVMKKEDERIELLNRIATNEDSLNHKRKINTIYNKTLLEIFNSSIGAWISMYTDIIYHQNYDILEVFYFNDRKIYTGIFLVFFAILLFFIEISE